MSEAEILESTYFDTCTIKRKEKHKNPDTGVTEIVEVVKYENVKCALSKRHNQPMQVDGVGNLDYISELFTSPSVDILEGDTVEVTQIGKISVHLASRPFRYPSHSQTILKAKERA